MNILHITTSGPDAGGVTQYIRRLSTALADENCTVSIAGRIPISEVDRGNFKWIDAKTDGGILDLLGAARQISSAGPFDIVHAHYRKASLVGRYIARAQKIPMLYTLHLTGIPMDIFHRAMSDFGDVTHAPSKKAVEWLKRVARVPDDRIKLIPHGINPAQFPRATKDCQNAARVKLGLPLDTTIAAYVGRFEHPKNEGWIVDLAKALPDVVFVMMGGGPRSRNLDGAPVTVFPYGDPLTVYQAADVLLLPSSLEGFSFVAAEAMSVGRAVLRTRTAGVDEMIVEGKTGFSCEINHDAFMEAARDVLSNRDRLRSVGEAAAAHVRAHLTHKKQVQHTMRLYRAMIGAA